MSQIEIMKNSIKKYDFYLYLALFACLMLVFPGIFVAVKFFPNSLGLQFLCMSVPPLVAFCIVSTILGIKANKANKAYKTAIKEKAKEQLTSEFQKVQLKTADVISKDMLDCLAKIDDDGKIVCQIHLDYEEKLNNYEEFTQFFSLDDK